MTINLNIPEQIEIWCLTIVFCKVCGNNLLSDDAYTYGVISIVVDILNISVAEYIWEKCQTHTKMK